MMMNPQRWMFAAGFVLLSASSVGARQDGGGVILDVSAARIQIDILHNLLTTGADTLVPAALRAPVRELRNRISRAFHPDSLTAAVGSALRLQLDEPATSALTAWGASRTGSKMIRALAFLRTDSGKADYAAYEAWAKPIRPSHRRALLLERLDQTLDAKGLARRILLPLMDTLLIAANAQLGIDRRLEPAELQRTLRATRSRFTQAIDRAYRIRWLYIFRSFTNDELQAYNELLESGAGSRFAFLQRQIIGQIFADAAARSAGRF